MLYGIAQAFGRASLTTQPQPQPPLPSCLTRVLCHVLASLFGFAEGAAGCAPPASLRTAFPAHTCLHAAHPCPLLCAQASTRQSRSASTVRLWPRPTATTHRPLDARPCADHACIVCAGMSRYGVTPNMLVLPPQMLLYMALAPEQKLTCAIILNSNLAAPVSVPDLL